MPLCLSEHVPRIITAFLAADRMLLCTDFDGTLVPMRDDPGLCVLDDDIRRTLASLHRQPKVSVAVVSGRRLADVRDRVGIEGIWYAGNHGLEIVGPEGEFQHPSATACRPALDGLASILDRVLADIGGARLEHKELSLTVHYRTVRPDHVATLRAIVARASSGVRRAERLRMCGGKDVIELRPDIAWGKGQAVLWLGEQLQCRPANRAFIGDDLSDEEAFDICQDGITIRVGDREAPSLARYAGDLEEVAGFLSILSDALAQTRQ
jgi:trehalose-phosphatase